MTEQLQRAAGLLWLVGLATVVVLAPAPRVDNSVTALMGSGSEAVARYQRFVDRFGSDEVVVARVTGGDPLPRLRFVDVLTSTLAAEPSMQGVLSVTALHPEATTLILDEVFGGSATLREQGPQLATPLVDTLDLWRPLGANVYALAKISPPEVRARLADRLEALRARAEAEGLTLQFTGPPLLNLALDRAGRQTEAFALPLLLLCTIVVALALTGSARGTIAMFVPVGLTVLASDGVFGALGGETNLLVNIAKPLLFVLGLASAIHVFVEAQHFVALGMPAERAPWAAARHKSQPVLLALTTTAIGFGSLTTSGLAPVRAFGTVAALGLLALIPTVLFTLPYLLSLLRSGYRRPLIGRGVDRLALTAVRASLQRPLLGPALGVAVLGVGGLALPALTPEPHAIRYFAPDHPLRQDQAALEAAGLGVATVEVLVSRPGLARDPSAQPALAAFIQDGAKDAVVAAAVGWPTLVDEARARTRRLDAWTLEQVSRRPEAGAFVNGDTVRLSFFVRTVDAAALDRLRAALQNARAAHLPSDVKIEITGNYDLLLQAQDELRSTLQVSLAWTAALMQIILAIALASVGVGLVALLPNLFPIGLNVLVMYVFDIPLDIGTTMTAAVALGIAVDDTLHFSLACKRAPFEPIDAATRSAGAAIIVSSVVIGLGFFALGMAEFAPTRRFGALCGLAMISALVGDLFVLPPLLDRVVRRPKAQTA